MNPPRPFTVAHGRADHWGGAVKHCLLGLNGTDANVGILYATEKFADDLPSILTFLRETTHIPHWIGAAAPGISAGAAEYRSEGALAVMAGHLPEESFLGFSGHDAPAITARATGWLGERQAGCILVHGDPRNPAVAPVVADLAGLAKAVTGGLVSAAGPPSQIADVVFGGGVSGLVLTAEIPVVTGLTQGCSPIGGPHLITEVWNGVVMGLDGRNALEVLKEEAGELIARDLRRAAGYIHVALPTGENGHDYAVRTLVGIDPGHGWLAIGHKLEIGQRLLFVRRDANGARADLKRMLTGIRQAVDGRPILAALYVSCVGRGGHMFGEEGVEAAMIEAGLDGAPLIGFYANGEIFGGRLFGYTGVLTVIVGERP
jgi:small ligand-binding sensory domain FIST